MNITNRKPLTKGGTIYVYEVGDIYRGAKSVTVERDNYGTKCDKCCFFMTKTCAKVSCHTKVDDNGIRGDIDVVWVKQTNINNDDLADTKQQK